MDGKRQAPKRLVKEIRRRGNYGDVKYEHALECGHTEVLVRASRAKKIACSWCMRLERDDYSIKRNTAVVLSDAIISDNEVDAVSAEIEISRTRASLASVMKVPVDAIEIVANEKLGMLEIRAAYVFLSAGDIRRLLEKGEIHE